MTIFRFPILLAGALLIAGTLSNAQARTVTLTAADCDLMATISAQGPGYGWMGRLVREGQFTTNTVNASGNAAILLRFRLDQIPKDQQIVRAELLLPLSRMGGRGSVANRNVRLFVWRLKQPWGVGASYLNRMVRPERVAWAQPGARGIGSDRASNPTGEMFLTNETGEIAFNVLNDVELWVSGSIPNHGWIVCTEDPKEVVELVFPLTSPDSWKLRITYER